MNEYRSVCDEHADYLRDKYDVDISDFEATD